MLLEKGRGWGGTVVNRCANHCTSKERVDPQPHTLPEALPESLISLQKPKVGVPGSWSTLPSYLDLFRIGLVLLCFPQKHVRSKQITAKGRLDG